jgi:Transposase DDE domain
MEVNMNAPDFNNFLGKAFEKIGLVLSKPLMGMLTTLIVCLLRNNKAHLSVLARALPMDESNEMAHMQKVRRFLSNKNISPAIVLLPLIRLLRPIISKLPEIVLTMDRTDWEKRRKHINILSVAVAYEGRALPLFWIVLGRKGSSSFKHWKQVLTPVIEGLKQMEWLSNIPIHVVADREFASPKLAKWLKEEYDIDSTVRIKRSMYLSGEGKSETKISVLLKDIKKGTRSVMLNQKVTRDCDFLMNILLKWDEGFDEPLIVATTLANPEQADKTYAKRAWIEPMHKDWKSNAFDLENTKVTDPKRIETLLIPVAFAYVLSVMEGKKKEENGDIRRPPKGKERMTGLFLGGIRSIAKFINDAPNELFKIFIRTLFKPFFEAHNLSIFAW